jgi:hypothetical protein
VDLASTYTQTVTPTAAASYAREVLDEADQSERLGNRVTDTAG